MVRVTALMKFFHTNRSLMTQILVSVIKFCFCTFFLQKIIVLRRDIYLILILMDGPKGKIYGAHLIRKSNNERLLSNINYPKYFTDQ